MSQAVVGGIGVIIGATITGVFQYIVRRRADTYAARAAARLLHEALLDAGWKVPTANRPRLPEVYDFGRLVDEWQAQRGVLAWSLTNDEWMWVHEAVQRAEAISGTRPGEMSPTGEDVEDLGEKAVGLREETEAFGRPISVLEAAVLDLLDRELFRAAHATTRLAFGRRYASRARREAKKMGLFDRDVLTTEAGSLRKLTGSLRKPRRRRSRKTPDDGVSA